MDFVLINPYKDIDINNNPNILQLKGQLHCHTTNSDGQFSPSDTVSTYRDLGYDFITVTDHDFITENPNVENITWIGSSVEETSQRRHTNAFNTIDQSTYTNVQDTINYHLDRQEMVCLNHPRWYSDGGNGMVSKAISKSELLQYTNYNFIEIYNPANNVTELEWDWVLSTGNVIYGLSVDDFHSQPIIDRGWIVVFTLENTKESILNSLKNGCFYASTGNDIFINIIDNQITATSSELSNFKFIGRDGRILQINENTLSATYTVFGNESYVRVKSTKISNLKNAWSQPIFIQTPIMNYPIYRDINRNIGLGNQLLINGNFDLQTMNIPLDLSINKSTYIYDGCWNWAISSDGGYNSPITATPTKFIIGELPNARNFMRFNFSGPSSNLGNNHYMEFIQYIEDGPRKFGEFGRIIRVDFWARSSMPDKKIALEFLEVFGSTGSPSESISTTETFVLKDYFKKYTTYIRLSNNILKTFTLKPYYRLSFWLDWGLSYLNRLNADTEEYINQAGTVDIAQVHVHLDALDLSYPIESLNEIEQKTQRHYFSTRKYGSIISQQGSFGGIVFSSTSAMCNMRYPVEMYSTPMITLNSSGIPNRLRIINNANTVDTSNVNYYFNTAKGFTYLTLLGANWTPGNAVDFDLEAMAPIL